MPRSPFSIATCHGTAVWLVLALLVTPGRADELRFNQDIRPILAENCFPCHGPDSAARKADLRLDQRDAAVDMGAISPGDPEGSELLRRIQSDDPEEAMPPASSKKVLTDAQKELLQRWIQEGAEYELHWSLIPPKRPEPPTVQHEAWVRNPIDRFVLNRLEAAGLAPTPEAGRRELARRLSLDLTGLPPDPSVVEAFVDDAAPDAYERLVDHFMSQVTWGEHRARYWLDYARYADSHGIHFDNYREMWTYRDWVIDAFNHNMPYDQFTIENLAGDLLPDRTLDQQIGSGFNRCNITTNEGGAIDEEYLVLYARDRTEATAQVWLGLTAGCAVCHDHKFDPLSQAEFYQLAAFFNNTTQAAMDGNIKDTPPIIAVPQPSDLARWQALGDEIPQQEARIARRRQDGRPEFQTWLATASPDIIRSRLPQEGLHLQAALQEGSGSTVQVTVDGVAQSQELTSPASWQDNGRGGQALAVQGKALEFGSVGDFERDGAFSCAGWVFLAANDSSGAICARMNNADANRGWDFWVQARRIGTHLIHAWPGNAVKVVSKEQVPANSWVHVAVTYDGTSAASGVKVYYDGKPQEVNVEVNSLKDSIRTQVPFRVGDRVEGNPFHGGLYDLRVYRRALGPGEVTALAQQMRFSEILANEPDQRTDAEKDELYAWWLTELDEPFRKFTATLGELQVERDAIQQRGSIAYVMQEKEAEPTAFVLNRGEYDQRRDPVKAGTPKVLPAFPEFYPRSRLGLARWLLMPEQPLTARVAVNRFWQEVFGTGLVRTTGDFGVAGELPSHPELLDWLAREFQESGWDIQHMFRLIVTSATYRQSAVLTEDRLAKDPQNRLLSRGPRFRMDAEMVRDSALATSGLLQRTVGGPSVKPYQPPGVWEAVAMIGSNTRDYQQDHGSALYRRSMYTFWKRAAPPASLDLFNAPSREVCTVRRERTNTPLQALATLNDVQFVEAARALAERALLQAGDADYLRFDFLARRLLARPLSQQELTVVQSSLATLREHYLQNPAEADALVRVGESERQGTSANPELAAWTMLANELMNLDEVLNK